MSKYTSDDEIRVHQQITIPRGMVVRVETVDTDYVIRIGLDERVTLIMDHTIGESLARWIIGADSSTPASGVVRDEEAEADGR